MYFIIHRTGNDSSFWREKIPLFKKKKVLKNVRNKLNHKIKEKNRAEWMYAAVEWTNNLWKHAAEIKIQGHIIFYLGNTCMIRTV